MGHRRQVPRPGRGRDRDAQALTRLDPMARRVASDQRRQQAVEFVGAVGAQQRGSEAGLGRHAGSLYQTAQRRPLRRREGGDADMAIQSWIDRGGINRTEAIDATARRYGRRVGGGRDRAGLGQAKRRFEHGHIDARGAGRIAHQRREGADEAVDAGQHLRRMPLRQDRRAFGQAERERQSAQSLDHGVVSSP